MVRIQACSFIKLLFWAFLIFKLLGWFLEVIRNTSLIGKEGRGRGFSGRVNGFWILHVDWRRFDAIQCCIFGVEGAGRFDAVSAVRCTWVSRLVRGFVLVRMVFLFTNGDVCNTGCY